LLKNIVPNFEKTEGERKAKEKEKKEVRFHAPEEYYGRRVIFVFMFLSYSLVYSVVTRTSGGYHMEAGNAGFAERI